MNILIVEDDVFYLDTIVKMVRGWTHDVTCAESGRAALEKAAAMDFDLFLLDVFLPDMTAIDLIPRLRSSRPDARIITLTGQSTRELERELRELGIAYYMAKPASQKELKSILDHMSRSLTPRTPAAPPAPMPGSAA